MRKIRTIFLQIMLIQSFIFVIMLGLGCAEKSGQSDKTKVTDSDGDGLPDVWEMKYFGNLKQTRDGDPDADNYSNFKEYLMRTNPNAGMCPDRNNRIGLKLNMPLR